MNKAKPSVRRNKQGHWIAYMGNSRHHDFGYDEGRAQRWHAANLAANQAAAEEKKLK